MRTYFAGVFIAFIALAATPASLAQAPQEKANTEVIDKIKEEGLKRSQVMETISFLTDVHGPRLTADLVEGQHLLMEVVDHDLRLGADGVFMGLHIATELPLGLLGVELRVVLHDLSKPVIA